MNVKMRQMVEREICEAAVDALLKAGFKISIDNGDGVETPKYVRKSTILDAMFQTDEEHLFVYRECDNNSAFGWVFFVYGNDGWDVLSDYTVNLEKFIGNGTKIAQISDKYSD